MMGRALLSLVRIGAASMLVAEHAPREHKARAMAFALALATILRLIGAERLCDRQRRAWQGRASQWATKLEASRAAIHAANSWAKHAGEYPHALRAALELLTRWHIERFDYGPGSARRLLEARGRAREVKHRRAA